MFHVVPAAIEMSVSSGVGLVFLGSQPFSASKCCEGVSV